MIQLSTKIQTLLVFVFLSLIAIPVLALDWPVKRKIDISSGFGDFRPNHFHAGIDIRTGGRVGEKVYSPVDGYIWRVKMSYNGYGKGLYIKGRDNHFYVFGHLLDFVDKIKKPVREEQIAKQQYYQDIYFEEDKIPIKKGELLGYTGQSGKGGPHLHFERRTSDNKPLNPLKHGLKLKDKVRPVFKKIGFQLTDDHSLFDNGKRKVFFDVISGNKTGQYRLDTTLYFNSPFGVLTGCFDLIRTSGVKLTVYKLEVYFDDTMYYMVEFDTVDRADDRRSTFTARPAGHHAVAWNVKILHLFKRLTIIGMLVFVNSLPHADRSRYFRSPVVLVDRTSVRRPVANKNAVDRVGSFC